MSFMQPVVSEDQAVNESPVKTPKVDREKLFGSLSPGLEIEIPFRRK
jgi:hypothetical protein